MVTFNGEIYNFQELRAELEARGHSFVSPHGHRSPAPRIRGSGASARFAGSTACLRLRYGIDDKSDLDAGARSFRHQAALLLGRTRAAAFCSPRRSKRYLHMRALRSAIDPEGLLEYLTFQNFFTEPHLVPRHSAACRRAAIMQIRAGQQPPKPVQYWDFHFEEPVQAATKRTIWKSSITCFSRPSPASLISDVEIGAYLSGGMDSRLHHRTCGRQLP